MSGPPPKDPSQRVRRAAPAKGEFVSVDGVGWLHGEIPAAPDGLMPASVAAWNAWMAAWFAAFWTPADLPGLQIVAKLYDAVERGEFTRVAEWRMWATTYGITPKGQQERRWSPPAAPASPAPRSSPRRYRHLRGVDS